MVNEINNGSVLHALLFLESLLELIQLIGGG